MAFLFLLVPTWLVPEQSVVVVLDPYVTQQLPRIGRLVECLTR
jgi:hypothetical protein